MLLSCCQQGLYVGGLEDINKLARVGQIQADDLQVLVGCAAWNPGQLRNEMWLGAWHVLAASNNILHECLFGESIFFCLQSVLAMHFGYCMTLHCIRNFLHTYAQQMPLQSASQEVLHERRQVRRGPDCLSRPDVA